MAFQMTVGEDFFPENLGGIACGVPIEQMFRFYFDWHSRLRREGADGVKVDAMGWLEAFSENSGGRSALYRNMMSSLEGSALLNFDGEIINCSGCVNDIFYHSLKTAVMRPRAPGARFRSVRAFPRRIPSAFTLSVT